MRIVLTNDDGYDAPGLSALAEAVGRLRDGEIDIIAPAAGRSGMGHSVSPEVRCRRSEVSGIGRLIVVEGTPADCVRVALNLPGQPRPDWVIAGINHGSNLGVDVYCSSTVAAAREAAILGVGGLAVSQLVKASLPDDWARTTREAAAVIAGILRPDDPAPPHADPTIHAQVVRTIQAYHPAQAAGRNRVCWNVNLPKLPADQPPTDVRLVPVSTDPPAIAYDHSYEDDGTQRLQYVGNYYERPATPGTDVAAAFAGAVAISPLSI